MLQIIGERLIDFARVALVIATVIIPIAFAIWLINKRLWR